MSCLLDKAQKILPFLIGSTATSELGEWSTSVVIKGIEKEN